MFEYAKKQGNILIVGTDTDARVQEAKGSHRPVNKLEDRIYLLNAIKYVDKVVSFNTDDELKKHLQDNNINIMVVGSDWQNKPIVGQEMVPEIHYFARIKDYSTTKTLAGGKPNE